MDGVADSEAVSYLDDVNQASTPKPIKKRRDLKFLLCNLITDLQFERIY